MFRELLSKHPENLATTMRRVVFNELSQQRNPSNMSILGVMFSYSPELSAKVFLMSHNYRLITLKYLLSYNFS